MKKYTFLVSLLISGILVMPVIAQTSPTEEPEVSPTTVKTISPTTVLDEEVDKLKEKVAEKVSALKGKNEKAISGIIKTISESEIVLIEGNSEKKISIDKTLTKYYEIAGTATRDIKLETIKKGDYIFVLGPDINNEVTANAIYKDQSFMVLAGKITAVSSEDFTVKIISLDKTAYTLDIQTRTTQQLLNIKTLEMEKIGFSKLKEGDSIHVVVKSNLENSKTTRFDAEKILIIPNEYFIQ